jgi:hypothetical protein
VSTSAHAAITQISRASQIQAEMPLLDGGASGAGWSFTAPRFPKEVSTDHPVM